MRTQQVVRSIEYFCKKDKTCGLTKLCCKNRKHMESLRPSNRGKRGKVTCHPCSRHKGSWPPSRHRACLQTAVGDNGKVLTKDGEKNMMMRIGPLCMASFW